MSRFLKLALVAATAAAVTSTASAQSVPASQQDINDNWVNGTGEQVWTNGTGELCWRNGVWTPATANAGCDGAPIAEAPPPPPPAKPVPPPAVVSQKVKYQAETLFDFDKSVLKPEGMAKLDDLAEKIKGINLEVIVATGHTDRIGTDKYNDALSARRARAVQRYLIKKGIDEKRIYTEAKGKRQPAKTAEGQLFTEACTQSLKKQRKALIACLAPDRRVEVEVVGTRTVTQTVPVQQQSNREAVGGSENAVGDSAVQQPQPSRK